MIAFQRQASATTMLIVESGSIAIPQTIVVLPPKVSVIRTMSVQHGNTAIRKRTTYVLQNLVSVQATLTAAHGSFVMAPLIHVRHNLVNAPLIPTALQAKCVMSVPTFAGNAV